MTNNYIAEGRDGYETLAEVDWVDTAQVQALSLVKYIESVTATGKPITKLPSTDYSTKSYIDSTGCDHRNTRDCLAPEA